jgi:signal transduction histidine kinase
MKHYLKQFTAWVTASRRNLKNNIFEKARIRLTVFYVVMMVIVMAIFSVALLVTLEQNIKDSLGDEIENQNARDRVFNNTVDNAEKSIMVTDAIVLLLVAGAGYFLAGRTLRPIKKTLDAQKQFTADASHDLRTPLAILKTESEVLLQSNSSDVEEYKKNITSNIEEIDRMSRLVADLLLIARTDGDNTNSTDVVTQINLKSFLEKIIIKNINQANIKGVDLKFEASPDVSINVFPDTLERAIQNILQNSINYTKEKGTILLRAIDEKNSVKIEIQDTGIGIAADDLPHVFDRFYKASHSRKDASGSGLGLPIAKHIVEQHAGNIAIKSTEGVGTTVSIVISKNLS